MLWSSIQELRPLCAPFLESRSRGRDFAIWRNFRHASGKLPRTSLQKPTKIASEQYNLIFLLLLFPEKLLALSDSLCGCSCCRCPLSRPLSLCAVHLTLACFSFFSHAPLLARGRWLLASASCQKVCVPYLDILSFHDNYYSCTEHSRPSGTKLLYGRALLLLEPATRSRLFPLLLLESANP